MQQISWKMPTKAHLSCAHFGAGGPMRREGMALKKALVDREIFHTNRICLYLIPLE
jgi:hypothetical protein